MKKSLDYLLRPYQSVDIRRLTQVIAIGFFVIGSIVSYIVASGALSAIDDRYNVKLDRQAAAMRTHVKFEFAQYEQLLESAAAFSELKTGSMTRTLWKQYTVNSHAITAHPSMLGYGYVDVVSRNGLGTFERNLSKQYERTISVSPHPSDESFTAISYLQPENIGNMRAIGYDMFSEQTRQQAMSAARDTDTVQMSGPVQLVQDGTGKKSYGSLLYYPVYRAEMKTESVQARRDALVGYTYIVVRAGDVAQQIDKNTIDEGADFVIKDSAVSVYKSTDSPDGSMSKEFELDLYGRTWEFTAYIQKNKVEYWIAPAIILLTGIVVSGILAIAVYWLMARRIKYLEHEHDKTIAETKNELVMLASHQLRTPASGVKQYLGMLVEGLAGEFDTMQSSIIQKAYDANERQIETIDQILHVAKADAGQLALQYDDVDIVDVVQCLVDEASADAQRKRITVRTHMPAKLVITCDKRFTTMAIENLISNAIKYSYEEGVVDVTLKSDTKVVKLIVSDHGVGVPEEDVESIFDKFVRIDNPLSVQEGGTGLGLFLAREIARAHKGSLRVKPNVDDGSVFTLRMPRRQPSARSKH
ncbi:MAG TPA: CHASE domain-containing protein [Patescibacteria group bacterium]|jgi:signal transduction histidine kinase|nr:CHASE domain-containing protein [Patescibacteria group bacterium]